MTILEIKAGDIVREVKTNRERVVVAFRPDLSLIAFDDSDRVGWSSAQGWIPTGRRAPETV